jgi:tetratricopeptide (TPR) repeat protein
MCYDAMMVRPFAVILALLTAGVSLGATREDLARARALFNERKFDQAIAAAELARKSPDTADAAAVVLARAHLERYRQLADPADLGAARTALAGANAEKLGTPDRAEYLIGLGGSLFLEDDFGAAAEIFESAVEIAPAAGEGAREAVLDWYGSAMERWAAPYTTTRRAAMLERLVRRMELEQAKNPGSRAAAYWLVAALRAQGETERAWQAAIAAWVRAPLAGVRSIALRADIDRLVREGIIPDRGKDVPEADRPGRETALRAEWELIKQKWK